MKKTCIQRINRWNNLNASGFRSGFLLDNMSCIPEFAWSIFKLSSKVERCVRLRRDSDGLERDFGFNGAVLDTVAIVHWLSGSNAFLVTIYDQSGNDNHAIESRAPNQLAFHASGGENNLPYFTQRATSETTTAYLLSISNDSEHGNASVHWVNFYNTSFKSSRFTSVYGNNYLTKSAKSGLQGGMSSNYMDTVVFDKLVPGYDSFYLIIVNMREFDLPRNTIRAFMNSQTQQPSLHNSETKVDLEPELINRLYRSTILNQRCYGDMFFSNSLTSIDLVGLRGFTNKEFNTSITWSSEPQP